MSQDLRYRIGIDVGDRSVGLAAFEFDDDGFPLSKLAMVTYRHDGGLDPTTNKSPQSRKATAGMARRTRRLRKRRSERLAKLDTALRSFGYPVPSYEEPQTYEAWHSRAILVNEKINDPQELNIHLVRALRHIARHRGWRNPWWRFTQIDQAPVPSTTMVENLKTAALLWPDYITDTTTVGELGALASSKNILLRPRTTKRENSLNNQGHKAILDNKVRQEDLLQEVKQIWSRQGLPEDQYTVLARALFDQIRPYVPTENVGSDPLPGQKGKLRASRASLEFIEFRVRDAVSNLRIKTREGNKPLSAGEYKAAVNYLLNFNEDTAPTWGDVAEQIGIESHLLIAPVIDDVRLNSAPYDRSSRTLLKAVPKNSEVRKWWDTADVSMRSLLILFLSDATEESLGLADDAGLSATFEKWPEKEREKLEGLDFESGRAAYSVDSLNKLNAYMAEHSCDLHTARKAVFGVDDKWQPPRENLDEQTGQPAVDRVLTIVRRFVMSCERQWGAPERIVIEHARTGLMGPTQRASVLNEIQKNRNQNERVRQELRDGGMDNPTRVDVRRHRIVQNQDCRCLYCGSMITVETAELDHIVPRSGGGSSRVDNLVAVCRGCNSEKGKIPFAVWASSTSRAGVSVEEAVQRLWSFDKVGVFKGVSGKRLRQQIQRRLRQRAEDEPIDERSLASTAYSAVSIRHRLSEYFNRGKEYGRDSWVYVDVYSGSLTRGSRRAGGIDEAILLRGQRDKNRFDVRHHAIDAAVLTLLNPSVARTLEQRRLMQTEARFGTRDTGWREFSGLGATSIEKFGKWRNTCAVLAELIAEAIAEDSIPVINPLRLTPANGSVHKDTLLPVSQRAVGEAWSAEELHRIADPYTYVALQKLRGNAKALGVDDTRSITTEKGNLLEAGTLLTVFPEKAASILAGTGAVKIGDSLHHARLYAWKGRGGKTEIGMVRVFGAELPWLMREYGTKDALTVPIHPGSQSYRDTKDTLRKKIESGEAQPIGWITQGDEIEIDVSQFVEGTGEFTEFLKLLPESRWKLDGFYTNSQFRIRPILLSSEELPSSVYSNEAELELIVKILGRGALPAVGTILGAYGSKILRRNNLGVPRWRGNGKLPTSIDIQRVAREALGE